MKTKLETGLAIAAFAGLVMKFTGMPFGNAVFIIAASLLFIFYFFFSFYFFRTKEMPEQKIFISVISGVLLSVLVMGIMYGIMPWPGSVAMVNTAVFFGIILFIILFASGRKLSGEYAGYRGNLFKRVGILLVINGVLVVIPPEKIIEFEFRNDPEGARLKKLMLQHPENGEYDILYKEHMEQKSKK